MNKIRPMFISSAYQMQGNVMARKTAKMEVMKCLAEQELPIAVRIIILS